MASTINAQTSPFAAIVQTADNTGNLAFQTANVTALTIDTSQNVGIGTASPAVKLDVSGRIRAVTSTSSAGYQGGIQLTDSTTTTIGLGLQSTSGADYPFVYGNTGLGFGTNGAERMRLDSSGNLGLGVTPSSWYTPNNSRALQFNGGSVWSYLTDRIALSQNWYINSAGTDTYVNTAAASQYRQAAGVHAWFNAPSGTAGNAISFTQAMTLDANGWLGIGATSAGYTNEKFRAQTSVNGNVSFVFHNGNSGASATSYLEVESFQSGNKSAGIQFSDASYYTGYISCDRTNGMAFHTGNAVAWLGSTERMRIDSSGQLGLGCTPSVVGSAAGYRAFYLGTASGSGLLGNGSDTYLLCNAYYDAAWKAVASANVSAYQLSGTTHYWRSAANPGAGGTLTWTNVMTLDKDQTLSLQGASTGVSGTGITFPATQSASSNANTLDDYEEGTWTPQFSFAGGQTGITYGAQEGRYTKVGRVVTIQCYCLFSNKGSSTGQLRLQNLPFANSGTYCCASVWMNSFTGLSGAQQAFIGAGDTYLSFFYGGTGVSFSITNTNTANNSDVMVNMSYITS